MNLKTWIPLALAVVFGLVAMKVARDVVVNRAAPADPQGGLVDVVVLKRDVTAGTALRAEDLTMGRISADVSTDAAFRNAADVEGRVARATMFKGQAVIEPLLAPVGTGTGLQAIVPRGMRAITVEINEFSGLAGFLVPGCRVDVVSTLSGGNNELISRTIVQNVEVTALGRRRSNDGSEQEVVKSATLLVEPAQAEAIELASSTGRPRLVLRSSGDRDLSRTSGVSAAELRGEQKRMTVAGGPPSPFDPAPTTKPVVLKPKDDPFAPVAADDPSKSHTVKVIRGGVESEIIMDLEPAYAGKDRKAVTDAK